MTCDTPGMVSKRGRTVQSAMVRTYIGAVLPPSLDRPINMISPMMEEIGPITGLTPLGNFSAASCSRSCTS